MEGMTNEQYKIQLQMIKKIIEKCSSIEEAVKEIETLIENEK